MDSGEIMQHIFIINPTAGKNDITLDISKKIHQLFMKHEIEGTYRIETTHFRGHATQIARKYAKTHEPIICYACGGDGTLNEVLHGIIGYPNATLAHIPCGTGNDFIKAFGHQAKEDFNHLEALIKGTILPIDVLKVNDSYSINITNVGLDATIAFNVVRFKNLPGISGSFAYKLSLATSFFTSAKHQVQVKIDDVKEEKEVYTFVVGANGRYYGGNYCVAPISNLQDGLMDIILVPQVSRIKILKFMKVYQAGEHLQEQYQDLICFKKAKKMELTSPTPMKICIDGEAIEANHVIIELLPSAISFLVPQSYCQGKILIQSK